MDEKLEELYQTAKKNTLSMIRPNMKPEDLAKCALAALNLANAEAIDKAKLKPTTRGAGS